MNTTTLARLQAALKTHQPSSVRATLADDETKDLAPGTRRSRWLPILNALREIPWVRVELLDGKGRTMGPPIHNDGAATELETISGAGLTTSRVSEVAQLATVAANMAASSQRFFIEAMKPSLEALTKTCILAAENGEHLRDSLDEERKKRQHAERRVVELEKQITKLVQTKSEGDEKGFMDTVTEVATALPSLLPIIGGVLRALNPAPIVSKPA